MKWGEISIKIAPFSFSENRGFKAIFLQRFQSHICKTAKFPMFSRQLVTNAYLLDISPSDDRIDTVVLENRTRDPSKRKLKF